MRTLVSLLVTLVVCLTSTPFSLATDVQPPANFTLEIGKNLDRHIGTVSIDIVTRNGESAGYLIFEYNPADGPFQVVVEKKLRELTIQVQPPAGLEDAEYGIWVTADVKFREYGGNGALLCAQAHST